MITSEGFDHTLEDFGSILLNHILSTKDLHVLYSKVCDSVNGKYLKLVLKTQLTITIIISYDKFYQVPVLYFQVQKTSDLDELILLHDLDALGIVKDSTALSIDNHPVVPGTFFLIHPCETLPTVETFMSDSQIISPKDTPHQQHIKYLITWNSIYGIGIFSDLYLKYNLYKST